MIKEAFLQNHNVLQSLTSINSVLSMEVFEWVFQHIKKDIWINSFVYTLNINSSFVGGCPTLPIYADEHQCRVLGCKISILNEDSSEMSSNEWGKVNISQPMPSMSLCTTPVLHQIKINDRGGVRLK